MSVNWFSRSNLQFLLGLSIGLAVSFVMTSYRELTHVQTRHHDSTSRMSIETFLHHDHEGIEDDLAEGPANGKAVNFQDTHSHHDDDLVAKDLTKKHPVLCWVMTSPTTLDKKAVHVRNTWAKRCNTALFMSSQWNASFPTIGLNVSEGRQHLTAKTMKAFYYIYENHFNDADWFLKADDDTYVVMENLHYMLSSYDAKEPLYFGQEFRTSSVPHGYASGGAGYVLSREALRRLATGGRNESVCHQDGGAEDMEIGKCLRNLGVKIVPTVDKLGRSRFHCFEIHAHLAGNYPDWYYEYDANGAKSGIENISDYAITFHYVKGRGMYAMEYLIYHLRPYGIISGSQSLNIGKGQKVENKTNTRLGS